MNMDDYWEAGKTWTHTMCGGCLHSYDSNLYPPCARCNWERNVAVRDAERDAASHTSREGK